MTHKEILFKTFAHPIHLLKMIFENIMKVRMICFNISDATKIAEIIRKISSCLSIVSNNYSFLLGQVILKIKSKHMQGGKIDENIFSTKISPSGKM